MTRLDAGERCGGGELAGSDQYARIKNEPTADRGALRQDPQPGHSALDPPRRKKIRAMAHYQDCKLLTNILFPALGPK